MVLMDAGYFPTTYFAANYFQTSPQYFPEYGSTTGGDSRHYYYDKPVSPRRVSKELLINIKNLLEQLKRGN